MNTPASPTHPFPYSFIAFEGNIGTGKTTLCNMLADEYNCRLVLEQFTDNPFLPLFYDQPERYAFPVELFFMTERHKQLQDQLSQRELFQTLTLADYFFVKTLLFAKNNLNPEEYRLFQRLFHILNASFPKPELLVYLHRPVEQLLVNIRNRGREYEQDIQSDYLLALQKAYFSYFRTIADLPILILDLQDLAFWHDPQGYEQIKAYLTKTYSPGIHRFTLEPKVQ